MQDARLVYKHYATLYIVFVFDSSENELAMLDLIQGTLFIAIHFDKIINELCMVSYASFRSKLFFFWWRKMQKIRLDAYDLEDIWD